MAKRTNYSFEKRQKEAKRKKKQLEKLEKKRMAKAAGSGAALPADGIAPVDGEAAPADETPQTSDG
jgi:hypothetical protein